MSVLLVWLGSVAVGSRWDVGGELLIGLDLRRSSPTTGAPRDCLSCHARRAARTCPARQPTTACRTPPTRYPQEQQGVDLFSASGVGVALVPPERRRHRLGAGPR